MNGDETFLPNWTSAPGDTIVDIICSRNLSREDFAHLIGLSHGDVDDLVQGNSTITLSVARRLNETLGSSVEFWMSRDFQYRQDIKRLDVDEEDWINQLPLGDMIKFGWITPVPHPAEELDACLRFFSVSTVLEWRDKYASLHEMAAFRTSPSFDSSPAAVATWLRQGEIEAEPIACASWNPGRFQDALDQIRPLTREKDPHRFIPELQMICARSGVAVVVVRAPSGCRASGSTRFISSDKAILQLSFRHLTDDHFWFTFFHEAGHLLLHGERDFFAASLKQKNTWILEGLGISDSDEDEANQFAFRTLVPDEFRMRLNTVPTTRREVVRLAHRLGISSGIVVGQLQHLGRISFQQLNGLKRRYSWND